jgi:hypothetical protein
MVKKLVIDVDNIEDAGDEAPSPAADIASSSFALRNVANALVTESAAVQAAFIQFQDTLAGSLDRLTAFMVKEQAEARENRHTVWACFNGSYRRWRECPQYRRRPFRRRQRVMQRLALRQQRDTRRL